MFDAIYTRQSIDKADSISVESQLEYCKYETRGNPYKVYSDKGYSGKNTNRPGFEEMMSKFKSISDDKFSDLKRSMDFKKRPSRRGK